MPKKLIKEWWQTKGTASQQLVKMLVWGLLKRAAITVVHGEVVTTSFLTFPGQPK